MSTIEKIGISLALTLVMYWIVQNRPPQKTAIGHLDRHIPIVAIVWV